MSGVDHVTAVDLASHGTVWSEVLSDGPYDAAADGTRTYVVEGCHLLALKRTSGVQAWRMRIGDPDRCAGPYIDDVPPIVFEGTVYAWTYDGVHAFDAVTGATRWRTVIGGQTVGWAATENWLVLSTAEHVILLDRRTGEVAGRTDISVAPRSAPTIAGDIALLRDGEGRVVAVDLLTMDEVWSSPVLGIFVDNGRPAITCGRLYVVATSTDYTESRLVALGPP